MRTDPLINVYGNKNDIAAWPKVFLKSYNCQKHTIYKMKALWSELYYESQFFNKPKNSSDSTQLFSGIDKCSKYGPDIWTKREGSQIKTANTFH